MVLKFLELKTTEAEVAPDRIAPNIGSSVIPLKVRTIPPTTAIKL